MVATDKNAAHEMLIALKHAQEALFWHQAEDFEIDGKTAGEVVRAAIQLAENRT